MVDVTPGNEGANEGFWRFQIRDKYGQWLQMGGAVTFTTDHPNYGRISGTGTFAGGSAPGVALIKVTNHQTLKDGSYAVPTEDFQAVKAIIPKNAPGLVEAMKLDAADGVIANKQTGIFQKYGDAGKNAVEDTPLTDLGFDPEEEIVIYRGIPEDADGINPGDWVTTLPQLAKDYAGSRGKVVSIKVKAKDLLTDPSVGEGAYTEEMIYLPSQDTPAVIDVADKTATPTTNIQEAPKAALTEEEIETLLRFTDIGYALVSNKLRRGMEVPPQIEADIETLTNLINSSKIIEDRIVYRGMNTRDEVWANEVNNLKIGDVIVDPGIGSTSPDLRIADRFATMNMDNPPKARAMFTLNVPKGSAAFDIPRKAHSYVSETETLLPPNTSIKVTSIEDREGVKYITADVIDAIDESGTKDLSGFTKLSGQKGSNPGGLYQDPVTGEKFYVKFEEAIRVDNEVLASKLYKKTGLNAIEVEKGNMDGKTISYSKWKDGATSDLINKLNSNPEMTKKLKEGYAVDAWLANWDVVGLEYDNLVFDAEGNDLRVDPGGALLYRAQGARKGDAFTDTVNELDTFQEKENTTSKIYGDMTQFDKVMSARKLLEVSDADIDEMVDATISNADDNKLLKTRLKNRRQYILNNFGLDGKSSVEEAWKKTEDGSEIRGVFTLSDKITGVSIDLDSIASPVSSETLNEVTTLQKEAIDSYSSRGYKPINSYLRAPDAYAYEAGTPVEDVKKMIVEMDNLLESSSTTASGLVFRGMNFYSTSDELPTDWAEVMKNLQAGDIISDYGYVSTSNDPAAAFNGFGPGFLGTHWLEDGTAKTNSNAALGSAFLVINVPEGAKALVFSEDLGAEELESEVLLPRNSQFRVKGVRRVQQVEAGEPVKDTYNYYIEADLVPLDTPGVIDVVNKPAEELAPESSDTGWSEVSGVEGRGDSALLDKGLTKDRITYGEFTNPVPTMDPEMFTRDQRVALKGYTGNDYKHVNKLLRTGKSAESLTEYLNMTTGVLDQTIDENGVLEAPARVFRGIVIKQAAEAEDTETDWATVMKDLQVGDVFSDKGFMSTSSDPFISHVGFGSGAATELPPFDKEGAPSNNSIVSSNGTIFWAIDLPTGTKALAIPAEFGTSGDEKEVLLARGTGLKVKAIRRIKQDRDNGIEAYNYYIDAEATNE